MADQIPVVAPGFFVGGDGRANGDAPVLGDFTGHKADAADIDFPVFPGKAQFAGEVAADDIPVQQGDRPVPEFHEFDIQDPGQGGFSGSGETGQKQGEPLLVPRRIGLSQLGHHAWKGEPFRYVQVEFQAAPEFGRGDVPGLGFCFNLIPGQVFPLFLDVGHGGQGNHGDPDLLPEAVYQFLGPARRVEQLVPAFVHKGIGLVRGNHEMRAPVVLLNQGLQEGFLGAGLAGGKGQEPEHDHVFGKLFHKGLVTVDRGEMVQIPGSGKPGHGLQKNMGFGLAGGLENHLLMGAVQQFFGVKPDDIPPAVLGEAPVGLGRGQSEFNKVVMQGRMQALQGPADIGGGEPVVETEHRRMLEFVVRPIDGRGLPALVRLPDVRDMHHGQEKAFGVAQGEVLARCQGLAQLFRDIQADRDGPDRTVR